METKTDNTGIAKTCVSHLRSISCAFIQTDNLLSDLHCVFPHVRYFKSFVPWSPFSTYLNIPVATIFIFMCQALSKTLYFSNFNTLQGNHNAVSDNTGQSRCRFYQKTTAKEQKNIHVNKFPIYIFILCICFTMLWCVLPILQVSVKPGQLVAVHQVLGMAKIWQRISVVPQVRQRVTMVISTFHHWVQQGVLAISCWVGPVCTIWKTKRHHMTWRSRGSAE